MSLMHKRLRETIFFSLLLCILTFFLIEKKTGESLFETPKAVLIQQTAQPAKETIVIKPAKPAIQILQDKLTTTSSVRGSQPDRPIVTNPNGTLTLSPAIIHYFDYFFSVRAQFSRSELITLLTADVMQHYPKSFQAELIRLFQQFLSYKADFALALETMSDYDVNYLFSHPNNFHTLKLDIQQNFFSAEEIDALFTAQFSQLSEPSQATIKDNHYQAYNKEMAETGTSSIYDDATQQRFKALQQQRHVWTERLNEYAKQRDEITANRSLDAAGKQQAIQLLLNSIFKPLEIKRVTALERGGVL